MMSRPALVRISRIARRASGAAAADRKVAEEIPIALSYGGTTHAVMMPSPSDREDFALGFLITAVVGSADDIEPIELQERMWPSDVSKHAGAGLRARSGAACVALNPSKRRCAASMPSAPRI
jgi:formate dehydrogenase accessory protein FdhD